MSVHEQFHLSRAVKFLSSRETCWPSRVIRLGKQIAHTDLKKDDLFDSYFLSILLSSSNCRAAYINKSEAPLTIFHFRKHEFSYNAWNLDTQKANGPNTIIVIVIFCRYCLPYKFNFIEYPSNVSSLLCGK